MEKELVTIKELVDESTSRFSKQIAYRMKRNNIYREWSYEEGGRCVKNLSASISELGIAKPVPGVLSFEGLTTQEKIKVESKVEPDDLLAILYTSGTTGVSKGVMLTHRKD